MKKLRFTIVAVLILACSGVWAQNAKKFYKTGEDFMVVENYKDAIDQFTRAIELEPDYDKAYLGRADAYERSGMLEEAVADYDRASTFLEKSEDVFYETGRLYFLLGDYDKSVEKLEKAISLKRTFLETYQVLSKVLVAQGKYVEAMEVANTALTLKESSENFYNRGVVNLRIENLEGAEWDFAKAVSKDKENIVALIALAELRTRLDKLSFAMQHVNKALSLDAENRTAHIIRSRIYVAQMDYPKAIDDISKIILFNKDDFEMYYLRGTYYQEFTQHSNAVNDFTKVLLLQPENADALYKRAWSYEQVGNFEDATKDYEALVSISQFDEEAQKLLIEAEARLFELYREDKKPEIQFIEPEPREEYVLQFPKASRIVSMKGRILDESDIKSLKINGMEIPVLLEDENWEFLAAVDIEGTESIHIEVSDVYDNVTSTPYTILLTEVDPPRVRIIAPYASDNGEIYLDSNDPSIYVEGKIEDESLVTSILINGVLASYIPNELNPKFSANLTIMNQNKITVNAVDAFGNASEVEFRLNRESAALSENNPMGKTWAVFIENSSYESFASLEGPGKDVTLMRAALAKYQVHNVIHKKDMNKSDMERFFSIEFRDLVRSNRVNSVLIWYAGHGKFINESGYWIPTDATRDDEFTYFNINALKASLQSYSNYVTHTLVITDACESGPSFYQAMRSTPDAKSCDDWQATKFKSSQVFSSAGYELAVDNSQFTRTFANSLANNPNACIPIEEIVSVVTTAVTKQNQQKPNFGKIEGLEDENGTFFFISKEY